MTNKNSPENQDFLYDDELSLGSSAEYDDYIELILKRINAHRKKHAVPVVAIAGAEGKTITMRMLTAILKSQMNILVTPPNCSTAHGITKTLLKMKPHHRAVLLEMGIVDAKQFQQAVNTATPNIAVITNIGDAHLATLGDKYLIADTKTQLISQLPEDGIAVLNIDDDLVSSLSNHCPTKRIIKFGLNRNAHFYASKIQYLGPNGIEFTVNDYYKFHLPIFSTTAIYNALTAIATARALEIPFTTIQKGLQNNFSLPQHRGNFFKSNETYVLDYSYDATINSVTKEIESLIQFRNYTSQLALVIGDIRDPGPNFKQQHEKFGYILAASPVDVVITIGKNAKFIADGLQKMNFGNKKTISLNSTEELPETIKNTLIDRSCVMFMGSKVLNLPESVKSIFNPSIYQTL